ncbi:MAG: hypothetical protein JO081_15555 [Alphaproteobacteria bacterium]|nr:hypothetical protein [Alphaproteobacteria bacterium]
MRLKALATAVAAGGLLALTAAGPAALAQPAGNSWVLQNGQWVWSPQVNVQKSERYHHLIEHNRGFREARMSRECGPITDPQLHQQCLDSFAQFSPYGGNTPTYAGINVPNYGSSAGPNYPTSSGQ